MRINDWIKQKFWRVQEDCGEVVHHREEKPFENAPLNFSDKRVEQAVAHHNQKWFHNEVVVQVRQATVEAQLAYAVDGVRFIIGASIRTRENLPSPLSMLGVKFLNRGECLQKAILFDGSMGTNYFHLLSDVLHKLYLLEGFTQIDDCPILVGSAVWDKPFFQHIITKTALSKLDWQLIKKPIKVEDLWISRPLPYDREYWYRTKSLFLKEDRTEAKKAIFINRTGTRHITNFYQVEPILSKYGITVVDPGTMTVEQQAKVFNSCEYVIGIHGAGMTNLVFCNHEKVKVLELCSNNRIGTQYYWLSTSLGIKWDMMLGGEANQDQSFELNPVEFEKRLEAFLTN